MLKEQKGSYTVEASLLMGIILAVLVGIIYMGFFLHDKAFMQAAAHEAASWACLHTDEAEKDSSSVLNTLVEGRLLGTEGVSVSASGNKKTVNVTCKGSFQMPGLLQNLFVKKGVVISSEVSLMAEAPSRRIQKIRGLMKIADTVRGKET